MSDCNIRVYIHPHVYQHLTGRAHLHVEKEEQLIAKWMFFLGRRYQGYLVIATLVTSRLLRLAGLVWNPASMAYVSLGSSPHLSGSVGEWQPPRQRPLGTCLHHTFSDPTTALLNQKLWPSHLFSQALQVTPGARQHLRATVPS